MFIVLNILFVIHYIEFIDVFLKDDGKPSTKSMPKPKVDELADINCQFDIMTNVRFCQNPFLFIFFNDYRDETQTYHYLCKT